MMDGVGFEGGVGNLPVTVVKRRKDFVLFVLSRHVSRLSSIPGFLLIPSISPLSCWLSSEASVVGLMCGVPEREIFM
jgi:hypothetical protein